MLPPGIAEDTVDKPLEGHRRSRQAKWYSRELKESAMTREGSFFCIAGLHLDLEVDLSGIDGTKTPRYAEVRNDGVNGKKRIGVLTSDLLQSPIINKEARTSIFLGHKHNRCCPWAD